MITKITNGKFYCGFCVNEKGEPTITQTDVTSSSGDKGRVTSPIICKQCRRPIPQSNQIK